MKRELINRRNLIGGIGAYCSLSACSQNGLHPPAPPPPQFAAAAFPLSTVPGTRHLIDASGEAFMIHGDTAWSLIADLSREDALFYLDDRMARGFNAILVSLLERKYARNAPANFYREQPFRTTDDYGQPNDAYFAHADWVLRQAQDRGILALITPSYLGWEGGSDGWYSAMLANGADKMRAYGRYLAQRFELRSNIMWVHGGDFNPPNRGIVRAIAQGIRDGDRRALHTVHTTVDSTALSYWPDEEWLSVNTVYTRSSISSVCAGEYRRSQAIPVFFIEGAYENEPTSAPPPAEDDLRRQAYQAVLSGAFGHVFGNNPIWHFGGPGLYDAPTDWRGQLSSRGAQSMTLVRAILSRAEWPLLVPDLDGEFLIDGAGGGDERAVAAIASDRRTGIVYLPTSRRIGVNVGSIGGGVTLTWIDPSSGAPIAAAPGPFSGGPHFIAPPGRNAANYRDWVLLAEAAEQV